MEQVSRVKTAGDEEVAMRVDEPIRLSAQGSMPANHDDITVTLKRGGDGLFEFSIRGTAGGEEALSFSYAGLSAEPASKGFRLAAGEPRLRIVPVTEGGATIEAVTARLLEQVTAMMRAFAPNMVGVITLTVE